VYLIKRVCKLREIDAASIHSVFYIDFRLCIPYTDDILSRCPLWRLMYEYDCCVPELCVTFYLP